MAKLHTQRLTGAAALSPPQPGMYLVRVKCIGGATPGSFSINFDGQSRAHFASTTAGMTSYRVKWLIKGTSVPAASIAFNGGISTVECVFSDTAPGAEHMEISKFRAIRFARTDGGAVTGDITVSYDVGPNVPKEVNALISASTGRFSFPATGALQFAIDCNVEEFLLPRDDTPTLPEANSLTLSGVTDAAATLQGLVFY